MRFVDSCGTIGQLTEENLRRIGPSAPEDLFDVKYLLENEGLLMNKKGFFFGLLASKRPIL